MIERPDGTLPRRSAPLGGGRRRAGGTPRSWRAAIAAGLGLALGASLLAPGCGPDDNVRYGPPNNLRTGGRCASCALGDGVTGELCPSFAEVFELLGPGRLGCTALGCHGGEMGALGLTISDSDPAAAYDAMAAYVNGEGRPYVKQGGQLGDRDEAYILCNLDGTCGTRMPIVVPGLAEAITPEQRRLIGEWVACGMPRTLDAADAGADAASDAADSGG